MSDPLPDSLLVQIGRIATTWTLIQQDIFISALALMHQGKHSGPTPNLSNEFKRLRNAWYKMAKGHYTGNDLRTLELLNDRLAKASDARGYALHGTWHPHNAETFTVYWFAQRAEIERYDLHTTLPEVVLVADRLDKLCGDVRHFLKPEDNAAYLRHVGIFK